MNVGPKGGRAANISSRLSYGDALGARCLQRGVVFLYGNYQSLFLHISEGGAPLAALSTIQLVGFWSALKIRWESLQFTRNINSKTSFKWKGQKRFQALNDNNCWGGSTATIYATHISGSTNLAHCSHSCAIHSICSSKNALFFTAT